MGVGRIPDLIYRLHGCIHRRIEANGKIGPIQIVIDGSGNTQNRNIRIFFRKQGSAPVKVPLPPMAIEGVDIVVYQVLVGLFAAFRGHKTLAAGSFQNSAAAVDNITDVVRFEDV